MAWLFRCTLHPASGHRLAPCPDCTTSWTCRREVQEIVLVDDDPDQAWELADALTTERRQVHVFVNALEAIHHIASRGCDVLLSDIDMPGMNGLQLAEWVARESPQPRIILISGRVSDLALHRPDWTFLPKPVDLTRLEAILRP